MLADDEDRHWQLYALSLEEVRAQVDRGWSYAQFFILLNGGTTAALLAFAGSEGSRVLAAVGLLGGAPLAVIGTLVIRENKRYYRALSSKRAALEVHLGLDQNIPGTTDAVAIYALTPTADAAKLRAMATDAGRYVEGGLRVGSVSGWSQWTLALIALFDLVAASLLLLGWV